MGFPTARPRRLRQSESWRAMVRETELSVSDFVYPMFIVPGTTVRHAVSAMPGVSQFSVDEIILEARKVAQTGVRALILFSAPDHKDAQASAFLDPDGLVPRAVAGIKQACPELLVWTDVCLCSATDHGHCGHVLSNGVIDNDSSIATLAKVALNHARAGADAVAPSDMMDGRVAAIRQLLDANGFAHTPVVSYAAKYASAFYGPFREAADSAPAFGDRRSYQMDPANVREALREVLGDVEEGADMVMVKPAGPYLDVIRRVREAVNVPVVAYQVSGEYSLLKAAAERGWIDERAAALETLIGIKRAGADLILSYFAPQISTWLAK
ncbi:MAG TPA: porphobilinogen synthase [Steroidobacteraceae bacterium]|nr:porphobilinogen synthase [Steroidobacteraceae bacterium]